MKKSMALLSRIIAGAAAALAVGFFASCQLELGNQDDRASISGYAVTGIEVTGQTKTFEKGSDFTFGDNATITATYGDGTTKSLDVEDVSVTGFSSAAVSDAVTVTVSYTSGGKTVTTSYDVKVTNAVTAISVKTSPSVTSGITFEAPNLSGLVINVTYEDGNKDEVVYAEAASSFTVSPEKFTEAGASVPVTVTYSGKSTTINYNVKSVTAAAVASYALDGNDEGVTKVGDGSYVADDTFTKVFKNVATSPRSNYLLLPEDTLTHSASSKAITIGFWVNANGDTGVWYPIFTAKDKAAADPSTGYVDDWYPMFYIQSRGTMGLNYNGYTDFTEADCTTNNSGKTGDLWNEHYNDWKDSEWHYFTVTITDKEAAHYIDGNLICKWEYDGTDGHTTAGLFAETTDLKYVALGGNQMFGWADNDAPYSFAKFSVWNTALNAEQIASVVAAK